MTHYTRATKKVTSHNVAYWVEGNSKNPPLILLSGFTGTHGDLLALARLLKNKYFLIIPEFPGWGETPKNHSTFTITSYAHVIEEIVKENTYNKITLVGHCMGTLVALEYAYEFPNSVEKLFLISVPYQEGTVGQIFFEKMADWSEKVPRVVRFLFFFWRSRIITIPISFFVLQTKTFHHKLQLILQTLTKQSHQDEHVLEKNWISMMHFHYQKLKKLSLPIHLIHGEKDRLIPLYQASKLQTLPPTATLDIVPHAGHLPPVETPESVARVIRKY